MANKIILRIFWPRLSGNVLTMVAFWAVLSELYPSASYWPWLILQPILIPLLTVLHVKFSKNPIRAEQLNLLADGIPLGLWIVYMQFNLLPSALLMTLIAMNNMAFGGPKNLLYSLILMAVGILAGVLIWGIELQIGASERVIFATLPILVYYPILMSTLLYNYSRKLRQQKHQLRHLSTLDDLSGLYNRRYWSLAVETWLEQNQSGTLLMLDLDHFKAINDQLGHATGDTVIQRTGTLLRDQMRTDDIAGRLGGEEFGVLLPNTTSNEALHIAERLRLGIAQETAALCQPLSCTVSIGLAERQPTDTSLEIWLGRADRALYAAKDQGRNNVTAAFN
ncbi:diguanylate cyclase [Salinispirillum marinum]|uniref:diguanylate cyclase n=2 Tax=Saccharospirillaceae TaxID=255527 RepID=A0ABV8BBH7_9GAMM